MKKFLIYLISSIVFLSILFPLIVSADNDECKITIGTVEGNTGDTVYVPISLENNPGISAVTVTVTYNAAALEYKTFIKGGVFVDNIMLKDHPKKNMLKFVLAEFYRDSHNNGDILTLKFKIKDNATAKLHKIDINYSNGDFAARDNKIIKPKITAGGIKVKYSPEAQNCPHEKYGEWKTVVNPTCTDEGIKQRDCAVCGKKQEQSLPKIDHDFDKFWTVDIAATTEKSGVMSRHCKHCGSTTDVLTFEYKQAENEKLDNTIGGEVSKNDFTNKLLAEQKPNNSSNTSSNKTPSNKENSTDKSESVQTETVSDFDVESVSQSEENAEIATDNETKPVSSSKNILIIAAVILLIILIVFIVVIACKKTV